MEGQGLDRMQRLYRYLDAGTLSIIVLYIWDDHLNNYESLLSSLSVVQVSLQIALHWPTYPFHPGFGMRVPWSDEAPPPGRELVSRFLQCSSQLTREI